VNVPFSIMDASQPCIWDMKKTAEIELSAAHYVTSSALYCISISSVGDWEHFKVLLHLIIFYKSMANVLYCSIRTEVKRFDICSCWSVSGLPQILYLNKAVVELQTD
jgi:hypothetical protein